MSASNPERTVYSTMGGNLEFQVDRIEPNGLVVGRNGDVDVPLGTVFVALGKLRIDRESPNFTHVDMGDVATIDLRLTEVHWFRKTIDAIPRGHSAGLRLEGRGLDVLADALASKKEREFLIMRT